MQISDAELVIGLQNRDDKAVDLLLALYADRLYNYVYYHSGNHHLAEDIASETFARIIEKIGSYTLKGIPFKAWVFRIAHNLLVDHFRKNNSRNVVSLNAVDWDNRPIVTPSSDWGAADGGEMVKQVADRDELKQAITALPEDQRTVFILRFIEGVDLDEIASTLDKSLPAIKSLQYRAVRNLRNLIDNSDGENVTKTR